MSTVSPLTTRRVSGYLYWGCYLDTCWKSFGNINKVTEDQAGLKHAKLVITANDPDKADNDNRQVKELVPIYLEAVCPKIGKAAEYNKRRYLRIFVEDMGERIIKDLLATDLEDWWESKPTWHNGARSSACSHIKAFFNWLAKRKRIKNNPAFGCKKIKSRARDSSVICSDDEFSLLLQFAPDYLRSVLRALRLSGCRPCEVLSLTDGQFIRDQKKWVIPPDKRKEEDKPRDVHLCDDLYELSLAQATKYPNSYLFPSKSGGEMSSNDFAHRCQRVRKKAGLEGRKIIPYSQRHSFANKLAGSGFLLSEIAYLCGNTEAVLRQHYTHLETHANKLHQRLNEAFSGAPGDSGEILEPCKDLMAVEGDRPLASPDDGLQILGSASQDHAKADGDNGLDSPIVSEVPVLV